MLRDITIGQYYPGNSLLHRLDPRVKFVGTLMFIISLFLFQGWVGYLIATAVLVIMIKVSKVPFSFMVKGLKAIVVLLVITLAFNIFLTPGTVIWQWKFLKITEEGLILAGKMAVRLVELVIGASLMTLTTTPNQLTDGLELSLIHISEPTRPY